MTAGGPARGRFITLEGGEGVGKSTLASTLCAALAGRGLDVLRTREPGGVPGAEAVRELLLRPPPGVEWSPLAETLLVYAARAEHLRLKLRPHIEAGGWVVCDRFSDSTRAYQGQAGLDAEIGLLDGVIVGDLAPDLTLILDAPPEAMRERRRGRHDGGDVIERRSDRYHDDVRARFLAIAAAQPDRCAVLDATAAPDAVLASALAEIDRRWGSS